jgi:hypothetical protein
MRFNMRWENGAPAHPFLQFLGQLGIKHICIQFPLMDQHLENALGPKNTDYGTYANHNPNGRATLRDGIVTRQNRRGLIKDFFGLFLVQFPEITVHNLTLVSSDRVLASIERSTSKVRLFFRPCHLADGEATERIWDNFCYNHRDIHKPGNADDKHMPIMWSLTSRFAVEYIDADWVRGKYDPLRDDTPVRELGENVDQVIQESSEQTRALWGEKTFVMSREVDVCVCCGKHQLSAVEVSNSCFILGMLRGHAELNQSRCS